MQVDKTGLELDIQKKHAHTFSNVYFRISVYVTTRQQGAHS